MKVTAYFRDVVRLEDRETVHHAFFDRGFLRSLSRAQSRDSCSSEAISDNLIIDFDA